MKPPRAKPRRSAPKRRTEKSERPRRRRTGRRRPRDSGRDARSRKRERHARLRSIDGRHPLREVAPGAVVDYPARRRHDARVAYFNFDVARQTGLLPASHPDRLDRDLERALLETFGLVIVNEWDEAHDNVPPARDLCPHPYMATRYLQLQHPDKRGLNSGDGRSIWNGAFRGRRGRFDVSSCGTGVTRLCPATSSEGRFFETGNALADYGCGTAHLEEGIGAALMSEAFARNGIRTERVLAVLALPSGQAINVRIAPNLLRPSHFFGLLRRRAHEDLRRLVLYYADREIRDGRWPALPTERARIRHLAERVAVDFARAAATFESHYIFCWLDWDGDNILCDGSIIDYGSVRQFGLFHHDYRFEDTDRMSTSIPEQRRKARQIVQRFVQIRELLLHGKAPPLASLRDDPVLARFDRAFEAHRRRLFAHQLGFDAEAVERLESAAPQCLERLWKLHRRLEKRRAARGRHRVADGLSSDAVHCMRDVLRELPARLLEASPDAKVRLPAEAFHAIACSDYASRADRRATPYRRRMAADYQRAYLDVMRWVADRRGGTPAELLAEIAPHADARNPYARMTGDGLTHATTRLSRACRRLAPEECYRLVQAFAASQHQARPSGTEAPEAPLDLADERPLVRRLHRAIQRLVEDYRESP